MSLFNPEHISAILCHYNALKIETKGQYWNDFFYLMEDFDKLLDKALKPYPMYLDIVRLKIDGATNLDIQEILIKKYNVSHSV